MVCAMVAPITMLGAVGMVGTAFSTKTAAKPALDQFALPGRIKGALGARKSVLKKETIVRRMTLVM